MAYVTVDDAIREVAQCMSLINGQGMTPYSDELIISLLQQANVFINGEQQWSENDLTFNRTLNGTTGKITVGISSAVVSDPKHVYAVYHESSMRPAPKLSSYINTDIATQAFGYTLIPKADDPGPQKLLIQWFPATLTGTVIYKAKAQYDFSVDRELEIPIDFWLHVYRAAWAYSVSDGTNPAMMDMYKSNYGERLSQVKEDENSRPIQMNPYNAIPDNWIESDDPYWSGP
jgi:hypothetical protein